MTGIEGSGEQRGKKKLTDDDMGELEQSASGRGSEGWKNPDLSR